MTFTFDGAPPETQQQFGVYSESGMQFGMAFGPGSVYLNGGGIAGYPNDGSGYLQMPDGVPGGNGSTRLRFGYNVFPSGAPVDFNLVSFDAARFATFANPTIEVVGYKAQIMGPVITVTNYFTVTSPNFQTFSPDSSFMNVFQVDVFNARWSLDNLVISGVPEPTAGSLALVAAGGAVVWSRIRRKHRSRQTPAFNEQRVGFRERGMRKLLIAVAPVVPLLQLACLGQPTVHFVDSNSTNPLPPYTNWLTAAREIQSAINLSLAGDMVVVTNGTYATGGRAVYGTMTNRVAIDRPITVQSLNGPAVTIIAGARAPSGTNGDGAVRGAYLTNGATLSGFTVTNGATRYFSADLNHERSGGGIWCEAGSAVVSNCVVTGNSASGFGGGVNGGTLTNCTIAGNWAAEIVTMGVFGEGGGACSAVLYNCLLASNISYYGGGAAQSILTKCVLLNNSATNGGGAYSASLNNCTVATNWAAWGGGAYSGTLTHCLVISNTSSQNGGGVYGGISSQCTLSHNAANSFAMGGGGGAYAADLTGCTLMANWARYSSGGGAHSSTLNNCSLTDNWVFPSNLGRGGGVYNCALTNCTLTRNSGGVGGGANGGTLINCTLVGNLAPSGGEAGGGQASGVTSATLNNCIVYFNEYVSCTLNYCCTMPMPAGGLGNITNAPAFLDYGGGNFRLQGDSPCINAGNNGYAAAVADQDGRPRIVNGIVDLGAFEYQGSEAGLFTAWLQNFLLPTDGSADFADSDADGMTNWQEWRAGTDPTNTLSVLRMVSATPGPMGATVSWKSVANHQYYLQRTAHPEVPNSFITIQNNISAAGGMTAYTDSVINATGPLFYRVGAQ